MRYGAIQVKVHRIKEIVSSHSGKFIFPIAIWRQKQFLSEAQLAPPPVTSEAPAIDSSDDEFGIPDPSTPSTDLAPPVGEVTAEAGPLPTNTSLPTGIDTRGMGLETFSGRGGVRIRKGSTRPPLSRLNFGSCTPPKERRRPSRSSWPKSLPHRRQTPLSPRLPRAWPRRKLGQRAKMCLAYHGSSRPILLNHIVTKTNGTHRVASHANYPKAK